MVDGYLFRFLCGEILCHCEVLYPEGYCCIRRPQDQNERHRQGTSDPGVVGLLLLPHMLAKLSPFVICCWLISRNFSIHPHVFFSPSLQRLVVRLTSRSFYVYPVPQGDYPEPHLAIVNKQFRSAFKDTWTIVHDQPKIGRHHGSW